MIRSMLAEVGMRMYTASKLGCDSRLFVMDSMTGARCLGKSDNGNKDQGPHGLHSPLKYQTA